MTRDPDTMPPGRTAIEALRLMEGGRYRHVHVVDGSKVVGIVSRFDFSGIPNWIAWTRKPVYGSGSEGRSRRDIAGDTHTPATGSRRIFGEVGT
jgi:hypothetical protein